MDAKKLVPPYFFLHGLHLCHTFPLIDDSLRCDTISIFLKGIYLVFARSVWKGVITGCWTKRSPVKPPSPSHDAAVCEMKSIPPATALPSKSGPTVAASTAARSGGSVKKYNPSDKKRTRVSAACHFSPYLWATITPPPFFFLQRLEPTSSPSTATHTNVAAVR